MNWIALGGTGFHQREDVFGLPELIQAFDLKYLNPAQAAINLSKADHSTDCTSAVWIGTN